VQSPLTSPNYTDISADVTGLSIGTTYHFRIKAENEYGTRTSEDISFTTLAPVNDFDGNIYDNRTIGTQVWMTENLKATHYNDGTPLQTITDDAQWRALITPAYWVPNSSYKDTFGVLYNWFTVDLKSAGNKNICPVGWHVPNENDWTILTSFLGGDSVAGGKVKEQGYAHWVSPNTGATNESGFNALPASSRSYLGTYAEPGFACSFWSSTEMPPPGGHCHFLQANSSVFTHYYYDKQNGFSVRCLKD
jgi:uncharacterized protein (TIGR02145 family)